MDDDWYEVERLDDRTYRIGEPRYWQRNNQYLVCGTDRALLFDSGCGRRDIGPVVRRLTSLPVLVVASHLHYDHLGGHRRLADTPGFRIAVADLPATRGRLRTHGIEVDVPLAIRLTPGHRRFPVHHWWPPGDRIDLGDRVVELLHLPGHTADSVGLVDHGDQLVLLGDSVYHAPGRYDGVVLAGAIPTSSVAGYRHSVSVLAEVPADWRLLAGHYAPEVGHDRVAELADALELAQARGWAESAPPWQRFAVFRAGTTRLIVGRGATSAGCGD